MEVTIADATFSVTVGDTCVDHPNLLLLDALVAKARELWCDVPRKPRPRLPGLPDPGIREA